MKKKIKILIYIILGYILYKSCLLLYFRDYNSYCVDYKKVTIKEKKVKVDKSLANTKIANLNLYIPDEFEVRYKEEDYDLYVYRPKGETDKNATININVSKDVVCYERALENNIIMKTFDYKKLLKKNNIKTESDLIKYYVKEGKEKNIFTSSNNIKMSYLSEMCAKNSAISDDDKNKNYYFSGDLNGTLYAENNRTYFMNVYNQNTDEYYSVSISKFSREESISIEELVYKVIHSIYFK